MSSVFILLSGETRSRRWGSTYRVMTDGSRGDGLLSHGRGVLGRHDAASQPPWRGGDLLRTRWRGRGLGGRRVSKASAGAFIVVARGMPHALRRLSDEPVRMLTLISPPGFEKIFAAVAEQGEDNLLADPDRLLALADKYGTKILGDYPAASSL